MKRRRKAGRDLNGILLLDKPLGISSNEALQQVKQLYGARKAGHTGSLDPLATGLLPICFGAATKLSAFLLDADKYYRVRIQLGVVTATGDAEGEILSQQPTDQITTEQIESVLPNFRGEIQQLPPMYSALKHQGERLYRLARQGIEVERQPRTVQIHRLEVSDWNLPEFTVVVHCSKGTYIRTLAEDIGTTLGCGAHVVGLERTGVGPFTQSPFYTMPQLQQCLLDEGQAGLDALLLPLDSALNHWPEVRLSPDSAYYLRMGQAVLVPRAPSHGWVRLYANDGRFIGVGQIQDDGRVAPRRLI